MEATAREEAGGEKGRPTEDVEDTVLAAHAGVDVALGDAEKVLAEAASERRRMVTTCMRVLQGERCPRVRTLPDGQQLADGLTMAQRSPG